MGDPALILFVTGNPALGEAELPTGGIQLEEAEASAERRQSRVLAMLDVPSRFVPTDVIELLAPFHESIRAIRLLRHCEPPRWLPDHYIALLELVSVAAAEALFAANQNRPFNSFEDDKCCLRFVARGGVVFDRNRRRSNSGVGASVSPHARLARHATSSQASSSPVASPPVARSPLADDAAAHARAAAAAIDSATDGFETASAATAARRRDPPLRARPARAERRPPLGRLSDAVSERCFGPPPPQRSSPSRRSRLSRRSTPPCARRRARGDGRERRRRRGRRRGRRRRGRDVCRVPREDGARRRRASRAHDRVQPLVPPRMPLGMA